MWSLWRGGMGKAGVTPLGVTPSGVDGTGSRVKLSVGVSTAGTAAAAVLIPAPAVGVSCTGAFCRQPASSPQHNPSSRINRSIFMASWGYTFNLKPSNL